MPQDEQQPPKRIEAPPPGPEAIDFKKKVDQVLLDWIKKLGGWVGAGSVLALLAILWAFYVAVVDGAKQEAARIAHDSVDPMTKTVGDALSKSLRDYLDAYSKLEEQKKAVEASVGDSLKTIQSLESTIKDLNKTVASDSANLASVLDGINKASLELQTLKDNLEKAKHLDTNTLATVATQLTKEDPELLPKLDKLFSALESCYTYHLKIADSNPTHQISQNVFTIKSQLNSPEDSDAAMREILEQIFDATTTGPPVGSANTTVGGFTLNGNHDRVTIELPPEATVVAMWDVPYGGVIPRQYVCWKSAAEPTKINVDFKPKGKDDSDLTVYILYKTPLHVADTK